MGVDASSCSEGEPRPAYCTVGCSATQTQEEGAKVLTSLRLETQPKLDTEYPLSHFMFPFAKHQPPFRSYPSFPFALLAKLLRLIFLGLVDEFSKFYYV